MTLLTPLEKDANGLRCIENTDLKLEVVIVPVSDVDRSKDFYASLGWRLDADFRFDNGFRVVRSTHVFASTIYISCVNH